MIITGRLNRRIIIEQSSEAQGTIGEVTPTWTTFTTLWAEFVSQTGREFVAAKQLNAAMDCMIRTRYVAGITAKMRVKYGTRIFLIIAPPIDVKEKHTELNLLCQEVNP
jgi:SPP1 family predicted phage head-tail adaptor